MNEIGSTTRPYDTHNPRFRKAYIRERLAALRLERDALIAERDRIDRQQSETVSLASNGAQSSTT